MYNLYRRVGGRRIVWCGKMNAVDADQYLINHRNAFKIGVVGGKEQW